MTDVQARRITVQRIYHSGLLEGWQKAVAPVPPTQPSPGHAWELEETRTFYHGRHLVYKWQWVLVYATDELLSETEL